MPRKKYIDGEWLVKHAWFNQPQGEYCERKIGNNYFFFCNDYFDATLFHNGKDLGKLTPNEFKSYFQKVTRIKL